MNQIGTATLSGVFGAHAFVQDRVEASELEQHQGHRTRYAQRHLGNREAALDAVQDTMLAALQAPLSFGNRSSVRTWLFGILKHKVMDTFRRQAREVPLDDPGDDEGGNHGAPAAADGQWNDAPSY